MKVKTSDLPLWITLFAIGLALAPDVANGFMDVLLDQREMQKLMGALFLSTTILRRTINLISMTKSNYTLLSRFAC